MSKQIHPLVPDAEALTNRLIEVLDGTHPGVAGCALAEVVAIWLASQPEGSRQRLYEMQLQMIDDLLIMHITPPEAVH